MEIKKMKELVEEMAQTTQLKKEENCISEKKKTTNDIEIFEKCSECGEVTYYSENGVGFVNRCRCYWNEAWKSKTKKYRDISMFDSGIEEKTFENCIIANEKDKKYKERLEKFCLEFEEIKTNAYSLVFSGNAGTGKTYYTACIYNELSKKYKAVTFNMSRYLGNIKSSEDWTIRENELLNIISTSDIVIIDDLGSEKISEEWGKEKLYNLIDTISRQNITCVISTNFNSKDLEKFLQFNGSDKIYDRLKERLVAFVFDWDSRRKMKKENIFF